MMHNKSNQLQNSFEASNKILPLPLPHTSQNNIITGNISQIVLRPYQKECIESIKNNISNGIYRLLCTLATGSGKTVIFASIIKEFSEPTLVLVHTHELQVQAAEKIKMVIPKAIIGFVNGNRKEFDKPIVVATVQSAMQPANLLVLQQQNFSVLIFDECHHAATDGAKKLLTTLGFGIGTNKKMIGFTATAFRNDKKGLGEVFDTIAYEKTIAELIAEDYLVNPHGFKVATNLDLSKVKTAKGDFQHASLSAVMDTPQMNNLVVDTYLLNAKGLKSICFSVNVQHAKNLELKFNERGIKAVAVYGDMPTIDREKIIRDYMEGITQILVNCAVLTEGFDAPLTQCVIIARPTQSLGLYQQMVGRGLRKYPNKKECIVIDFNEVNHNICNVAMLLKDAESKVEDKTHSKVQNAKIPSKLDPDLKAALRSYNPISEDFLWEKITGSNTYFLKGINGIELAIEEQGGGFYCIVIYEQQKEMILARDLAFEYAFGFAEDIAKKHRKIFVFADSKAPWRNEPLSKEQFKLIKKLTGNQRGLSQLTKGQASFLIDHIKKTKKN